MFCQFLTKTYMDNHGQTVSRHLRNGTATGILVKHQTYIGHELPHWELSYVHVLFYQVTLAKVLAIASCET